MMHRMPFAPPPEGFRDRFVKDGWRGIERYYGARTEVMLRWIEESGGLDSLKAERRAYRDAQRASVASSAGIGRKVQHA